MLGRVLLALGGLALIGTAAFHATGGGSLAGWVDGDRALVLQLLWHVPTLDWTVVGLTWLFIAWRGSHRLAPLVWLLALMPGGVAVMLAFAVGSTFIGMWLLAGATLLALLGSIALPLRAV